MLDMSFCRTCFPFLPAIFPTTINHGLPGDVPCPSCAAWASDGFRLYEKLEAEGKGRKTIKAQHLWFRILEAQMETGEGGVCGPFGPGLDPLFAIEILAGSTRQKMMDGEFLKGVPCRFQTWRECLECHFDGEDDDQY